MARKYIIMTGERLVLLLITLFLFYLIAIFITNAIYMGRFQSFVKDNEQIKENPDTIRWIKITNWIGAVFVGIAFFAVGYFTIFSFKPKGKKAKGVGPLVKTVLIINILIMLLLIPLLITSGIYVRKFYGYATNPDNKLGNSGTIKFFEINNWILMTIAFLLLLVIIVILTRKTEKEEKKSSVKSILMDTISENKETKEKKEKKEEKEEKEEDTDTESDD